MAESVRTHSLAGGMPGSSTPPRGAGGGVMGLVMHRMCAATARHAPAWCVRARRLALPGVALLLAGCEPMVGGDGGGGSVACPGGPDPLYGDQWHLENTGQTAIDGSSVAATPGVDLGVAGAWSAGYRGSGVGIAVLDDAVDIGHEDLRTNVLDGRSVDYTTDPEGDDPSPAEGSGLFHGTAVAGMAASRDQNSCGGRGSAPRAGLAGFNILSKSTTAAIEDALTRDVAVSNNSWGPEDRTGDLRRGGWQDSVRGGTKTNRDDRGTIYVWAAGNGYGCVDVEGDDTKNCEPVDDSNYDGAANYWRVLAISAVDAKGRPASYSERGANILASAPGGRFCSTEALTLTTTFPDGMERPQEWADIDYPDRPAYTRCFNGTSAAAPGVAGVAALVLEANPDLSWREVRWILATTAQDDFQAADAKELKDADAWATNNAGHDVSHAFGHGLVDAGAAVQRAEAWSSADRFPALESHSQKSKVDWNLVGNSTFTDDINISNSRIETIEAVEVTLGDLRPEDNEYWSHDAWNQLDIELQHLDGNGEVVSRSLLAEEHYCSTDGGYALDACPKLADQVWTFSTTHHLGESADGDWRLEITNNSAEDGRLDSWTLTFHGH